MNKIDWQTGDALYEGHYLTTVKNHKGDIIVIPNYYSTCDGWVERDGEILAFYPCSEIKPYVEPKFKIGEFVVENGIIGTITAMNDDGTYFVVGAALMPMTFTPNMCRLATSDEALSLSAKWRERGMYYDIETNEIKKL